MMPLVHFVHPFRTAFGVRLLCARPNPSIWASYPHKKNTPQCVKSGGKMGIRTPDRDKPYNRFRVCRIRPLCHLSVFTTLNLLCVLHAIQTDQNALRSFTSFNDESAAFDHWPSLKYSLLSICYISDRQFSHYTKNRFKLQAFLKITFFVKSPLQFYKKKIIVILSSDASAYQQRQLCH